MTLCGFMARGLLMPVIAGGMLVSHLPPLVLAAEEGDKPERPVDVQLPPLPQAVDLIPLYVAPNSTNRFFVDGASMSVDTGGLIRYTMVIKSPSGATTINFEGMRCPDLQRAVYAFGQADGTWTKARNSEWGPIGGSGPNGYQYVLYRHYLCPDGVPVGDAAQAVTALRRGAQSASRLLP